MKATVQQQTNTKIRFCPSTVEHPFDTNFAPSQPGSDWARLVNSEDEEYALILCAYSDHEFLVWLPSRGETVLANDLLCRAA
ncbi:MAG: hypothetical protein HC799_15905 [Limnothrix sp. RL_2_0]|nr:hypothetical protein [Limnothrix sp. RL_2_0]